MTFSTTPTDRPASPFTVARPHPGARAFTLVEVMIAAALSSVVLAGVLSAFLMLGRSGVNLAGYSVAESEMRRGLEEFSQDVRMASNLAWNSATSVTLTVPHSYASSTPLPHLVTYAYDSATATFHRRPGDATSTVEPTIFIRDVSSFSFTRYNRLDAAAATNAETKRIQITLNIRKTGRTLVAANTTVVSASYTLRNKPAN